MSDAVSPAVYLLFLLMGVVSYVALHHLWIWAGRRSETVYLWVVAFGANTLLLLLSHYVQISAGTGARAVLAARLTWASGIFLVPLMVGLSHALAGSRPPRLLLPGLTALSAGLSLALWLTEALVTGQSYVRTDLLGHRYGAPMPGRLMPLLIPYVLAAAIYCLAVVRRGETLEPGERRVIRWTFLVYALLALNDMLHAARLITSVRVFDYGFVAVAVGLTYMLVRRSNRLHAHLEEEVAARTQELSARQAELAALLRAAQTVMGGLDLESTLQRIIQEASHIAGTPHVKILLVDKEASVLRVGAAAGVPMPPAFQVPLGTSYSGTIATTGQPLFIADTRNDPRNLLARRDREQGILTFLGLPIKMRQEVLGVLTFNTESPHEYSPEELAYLSSFADITAIAIDNARLYETLEGRLARLETLTRLNRLISSSLATDTVLREMARSAAELMAVPAASFWVADEAARTLELVSFSDPAVEVDWPRRVLSFDEGVLGWIAAHRRSQNVPDVFADGRFVAPDWWRAHGLTSFVGFPVVLEGSVLAVLALNGRRPFRLGREDQNLIEGFLAQAAVAIRNASLYEAEGRARREAELALAQVKQLQGLLPICAYCKKIRNDRNYWEQIETYIGERSQASFSHGICPECREKIVGPQLEEWRRLKQQSS